MSLEVGRHVLRAEIAAIQQVHDHLDSHFEVALDLMERAKGRIVTCGMGKAGIIARKIAATLASTGSPAFFLHPADALHGDLGMVGEGDVALVLSNSGESEEITKLLPCLRSRGVRIIAITASDRSTLAAHADVCLFLGAIEEACPLGLAPTATTTAMLALGDALAIALMQRRGFNAQDFARLHPAGTLGRKMMPVEHAMRIGDAVATVPPTATVSETLLAITRARSGAAIIVDEGHHVLGIFCDGDLRRGIEQDPQLLSRPVAEVMTRNCRRVKRGTLVGEVLDMMRRLRIAEIPVVDQEGVLLGVADLKGLVASL